MRRGRGGDRDGDAPVHSRLTSAPPREDCQCSIITLINKSKACHKPIKKALFLSQNEFSCFFKMASEMPCAFLREEPTSALQFD